MTTSAPGTEVFVAEMGTYGPGEIAALCEWVQPDVSAIVAIGPVHLERFKSEERIVAAKAEILDGAAAGVIGVDHPLLAELAESKAGSMEADHGLGREDRRHGQGRGWPLDVDGRRVARVPDGVFALNLGVAVGISMALGMSPDQIVPRLGNLPQPEHRQTVTTSERGLRGHRRHLQLQPGRGEEGPRHADASRGRGAQGAGHSGNGRARAAGKSPENLAFAAAASMVVDDILVVGKTNRSALVEGSGRGEASVTVVASRDAAVDWVRDHLGPGDAVLYENDLPDHYP